MDLILRLDDCQDDDDYWGFLGDYDVWNGIKRILSAFSFGNDDIRAILSVCPFPPKLFTRNS